MPSNKRRKVQDCQMAIPNGSSWFMPANRNPGEHPRVALNDFCQRNKLAYHYDLKFPGIITLSFEGPWKSINLVKFAAATKKECDVAALAWFATNSLAPGSYILSVSDEKPVNRLAQTETSDAISTSVTYYNLQIRTKIEHQVSEKATTEPQKPIKLPRSTSVEGSLGDSSADPEVLEQPSPKAMLSVIEDADALALERCEDEKHGEAVNGYARTLLLASTGKDTREVGLAYRLKVI